MVGQAGGRLTGTFWDRSGDERRWLRRGAGGARVAAATVIEAALPLSDLGVGSGAALSFFLAVFNRDQTEVERHPDNRAVMLTVPDERFEARNWTA